MSYTQQVDESTHDVMRAGKLTQEIHLSLLGVAAWRMYRQQPHARPFVLEMYMTTDPYHQQDRVVALATEMLASIRQTPTYADTAAIVAKIERAVALMPKQWRLDYMYLSYIGAKEFEQVLSLPDSDPDLETIMKLVTLMIDHIFAFEETSPFLAAFAKVWFDLCDATLGIESD